MSVSRAIDCVFMMFVGIFFQSCADDSDVASLLYLGNEDISATCEASGAIESEILSEGLVDIGLTSDVFIV